MTASSISAQDYDAFRDYLEQACGIVLGDNKHYLVLSRLGRLMEEGGMGSLGELVTQLRQSSNRNLKERVIEAMTTNETFWFRDTFPFDILRETILPDLAARRVRVPRVWSAACSSGQEAYSISMTVQEFLAANPGRLSDVEILGTDISPAVIREAEAGRYDSLTVARGLSEARREKYFKPGVNHWEVRPEIKRRVRFTQGNLLQAYAGLGRFDVIFCRNVLIYFSTDVKRDIITKLTRSLNPGGYLFLGSSESLSQYSSEYELIRAQRGSVYRLRNGVDDKADSPAGSGLTAVPAAATPPKGVSGDRPLRRSRRCRDPLRDRY